MDKYWEEYVEMRSPEEVEEYYNSREDETVERYFDNRKATDDKATEFLRRLIT